MVNSAEGYQLPDVFISDMFVDTTPSPYSAPSVLEVANSDMLLAQELLSDLIPVKSTGSVRFN